MEKGMKEKEAKDNFINFTCFNYRAISFTHSKTDPV